MTSRKFTVNCLPRKNYDLDGPERTQKLCSRSLTCAYMSWPWTFKVLFSRLPPERTAKRTQEAKGEHVLIGSCCVQGFRATMEDEVIIEASLPSPLQSWSLAAVLDGHGGDLGNDF